MLYGWMYVASVNEPIFENIDSFETLSKVFFCIKTVLCTPYPEDTADGFVFAWSRLVSFVSFDISNLV